MIVFLGRLNEMVKAFPACRNSNCPDCLRNDDYNQTSIHDGDAVQLWEKEDSN